MTRRFVSACLLVLLAGLTAAQEPSPDPSGQLPRFRGGANLVRVDAYISQDGTPITDLTAEDFEVFEDDMAQRVESFELIRPAPPVPQGQRVEPNTVAESNRMAADPDSRVFVLFMDVWHVQLPGSFRAQRPVVGLLDRVIGRDDLIGVMTPEMSARNLTLARRTTTLEGILKNNWFWGERGQVNTSDPREDEIRLCYPAGEHEDIALEMIERRREAKTLGAIEDLIIHLEGLREERKFVVLLSEGWVLHRRNERLARPLSPAPGAAPRVPGRPVPIGIDDGRLTTRTPTGANDYEGCERERTMLAYLDHEIEFRQLLQRANRANVSFYVVDPRGLVAFDTPMGPDRPLMPSADARQLLARQTALRDLAHQTDGVAVLNTNNVDAAMQRMLTDVGSYYLLGYYSTNTRLDGKFRRITVRVKRPGAEVRARPGYLAPTEAELASARVDALMNGAEPGHATIPRTIVQAFERLAPARGNVPLRAHAVGGPGYVWLTAELDLAASREPEWQQGGTARIVLEHATGATPPRTLEAAIEPGERRFSIRRPEREILPPGRYLVRLQLTSPVQRMPLQLNTDVVVPDTTALIGSEAHALRRGPTTGLEYFPTADARYRRTERIRLQIPRVSDGGAVSARLVNPEGQELPLVVSLGEALDDSLQLKFIVADLTLAALAQGEYAIEVAVEQDGRRETVEYAFRIVP